MPFPNPATQLKGSLPGRTLPAIGKRRAHKERREAEKRIAINGPPPLFEGDSVDYYRDVLSGKIPSTEPERARAADRLFEVDLKIREQKLAAEAELIQAARVKACLDEGTILVRRKKMGKDSTHSMDRDELRDLRKLQRATNSPYVFTTERGGPLSVRALQYIVAEAGEEAGLPEHLSHPHALRHAAGYSLINNDVDVRLVQEFLGHKTPAKRLAALRVR